MNKLAIPAILVSLVMVAGIFAFMPVDKAVTVHQSIIDAILAGQGDVTAVLSGAHLIRIQTFINNDPTNTSNTTWDQIITYDRTAGTGAWQIEKLFLCDIRNNDGAINVGYDVETLIVGPSQSGGKPSLVDHTPNENPVQTRLHSSNYNGECVNIKNVALTTSDLSIGFMNVLLGGDRSNNVNVRLDDTNCSDEGQSLDGAWIVAYIIGLDDRDEMAVTVHDDVSGC